MGEKRVSVKERSNLAFASRVFARLITFAAAFCALTSFRSQKGRGLHCNLCFVLSRREQYGGLRREQLDKKPLT